MIRQLPARQAHVVVLQAARDALWRAMNELGIDAETHALHDAVRAVDRELIAAKERVHNAQDEMLGEALNRLRKGRALDMDVCTACATGSVWDNDTGQYVNCGYCGGLGLVR